MGGHPDDNREVDANCAIVQHKHTDTHTFRESLPRQAKIESLLDCHAIIPSDVIRWLCIPKSAICDLRSLETRARTRVEHRRTAIGCHVSVHNGL